MNTIKVNKKGTLMIAHRGVSGLEKENSCPAFIAAGVKTYYGIETDVHVTKDGKFIICHDDDILRVTGTNLIIKETNFAELRKYNLLENDGSTRSDLVLPTLEDYIRICKKYNKRAVLELKEYIEPHYIQAIVDEIKKLEWYENTTFISFWRENLIALREYCQDADMQYLTCNATEETFQFLLKYRADLDIQFCPLTKEYIDKLHTHNIKINCWTVDSKKDANRLIKMGVDMITSNILE